MVVELLIIVLSTLGSVFVLLAAVGLVRMPDVYLRMSASTKAATLGMGLLLTAAAFHFGDAAVSSRVVAIVFFIFITAPIGAHLIGRAAYKSGVQKWKNTHLDELAGKYTRKGLLPHAQNKVEVPASQKDRS
jgi:multicomponent Na+:H+ antiporter subunit G